MKEDDTLIKSLEAAFKKLSKVLEDQTVEVETKVKVFNAGVALAKVKHAISEQEGGAEFNPDFDKD